MQFFSFFRLLNCSAPGAFIRINMVESNTSKHRKPEAHGPQRSPEYTAMKAIFSQNTVNVACQKK